MRCVLRRSFGLSSFLEPLRRYASVDASIKAGADVPLPLTWSQTEVENWLAVHATAVNAGKPIEVNMDMFAQGFDRSLYPVSHCATSVD